MPFNLVKYYLRRISPYIQYQYIDYEETFYNMLNFITDIGHQNIFRKGHYYEFGLGSGDTFLQFYHALKRYSRKIRCNNIKDAEIQMFGFDCFEGLPGATTDYDSTPFWDKGSFACSKKNFENIMSKNNVEKNIYHLYEGFYENILTDDLRNTLTNNPPMIIMMDCDYYSSTKIVLEWLRPLLVDGVFFIFDDVWSFLGHPNFGERKAIAEFNLKGEGILAPHHFGKWSDKVYVYTTAWRGSNYQNFLKKKQ